VYYRLRQVDLYGTFSYSPVHTVAVSGRYDLALFPNPTTHATALTGTQPSTGAPCSKPLAAKSWLPQPIPRAQPHWYCRRD
jgi:hypothetical protein